MKLPTVKLTTNTGYTWTTNVSAETTEAKAIAYFMGNLFDVSNDPELEKMETVVKVEFTPKQEVPNLYDFKINYQELSTILAALRKFQELKKDEVVTMDHFLDCEPLTSGFDGSTGFSHEDLRHLIWDWFHPVVPLTTVRALGKKLAAWSLQPEDAIARLSAVLCQGEKKPPVRLVVEAMPLLKSQQGAIQFSLLGKPKNVEQLDALVDQLEKYCTPP